MAGGNPNKGSTSLKPSPSTSNRKSRWESGKNPTSSDTKSGKNPSSFDNKLPKPKDEPSPNQIPPQIPNSNPGLLPPPGPHNEPPGAPFPDPTSNLGPPPPAYGFHMLERRTIALADGHIRSYFALPPDYQDLPPPHPHRAFFDGPRRGGGGADDMFPPPPQQNDYWNSLGLDGRGPPPQAEAMLKRKFGEGDERERDRDRDEFARQRQHVLQYGNPNGFLPSGPGTSSGFPLEDMRAPKQMRLGGGEYDLPAGRGAFHDVDQQALKKAFLRFVKLIYENPSQKANYLENGKQGALQCIACGRASKDFPDMHGLITHVYGAHSADLHVDHLGLHKALCVLMGWNYAKVPDSSKAYQSLSANEAEANQEDLVLWPPLVIIHNTNTGRGKDGRMEGMGNKVMDNKLRDLGFGGGKAKSLYGKDGHQGITLVKFAPDQSGLKEAVRLAEYFEKDYHGRKGWARAQSTQSGRDDESNPNLVKMDEKTRENQRILYGYLAIAADLEKVDFETKKKATIESKRELKP